MNIKTLAAIAAAAVMAVSVSACGNKKGDKDKTSDSKAESSAAEKDAESTAEEDSVAETTTAAPESKPEEEEEEKLNYIGEKDAKKADYSVEMTNGTGQEIVGFAINYGDGEYSENLIPSDEYFDIDEVRLFNWSHTVSGDIMTLGDFNVEITLVDGETFELHGFPLTDMLSGEIRLMDEYAFLVYTNKIGDVKDTMKKEADIAEAEREKEEAKTSTTMEAPVFEPVEEEEDTTTTTTAPESQPEDTQTEQQTEADQMNDEAQIQY